MMTSALALSTTLTSIRDAGTPQDRFIKVAALYFGLASEDAEAEAVVILVRAVKRLISDIENLPFEENYKTFLRQQISSFLPLSDFSHIYFNIDQAKQHFLSDENLVNLQRVHMVLAGFTKLPTLDDDTKLIANELRELRESIAKLELPQDLKKAILYRIGQIITAIEHFILFGSEQLVTEISTLVGVLVLSEKALNHESKASIKKLGAYISKLLSGIEKVDKGANGASGLLEKGQSVLKLFSDQ